MTGPPAWVKPPGSFESRVSVPVAVMPWSRCSTSALDTSVTVAALIVMLLPAMFVMVTLCGAPLPPAPVIVIASPTLNPAAEATETVVVPTPAVRNLIREGKTHQIMSVMQTGASFGMQTMEAALATLVRQGKITSRLAEQRSSSPEELKRLMGTGVQMAA